MFANKLVINVLAITSLLEATPGGKRGLFRLRIGPRGRGWGGEGDTLYNAIDLGTTTCW